MKIETLAIIGGGASAALLLAHLAERPQARALRIDVYDRAGAFAKGIAYATPHDCHLLNVRAANMSALASRPDDFARWAAGYGYAADDFVPRKLYGRYLAEHWARAERVLSVRSITADVVRSRRTAQGYEIACLSGERAHYDAVIQATGNCAPLSPRLGGAGGDFYAASPWVVDYAALKQARDVVLVGSGLSAVDAVLALDAQGYEGRIHIISRRGLLPAVHVEAAPAPFDLFPYPDTALGLLRGVRRAVARHDGPWQAVIDALRPHTNPIWQALPERQRAQLTRRLLTYWNVHRHRMAPAVAAVVERWERDGRLHRIRAGVSAVGSDTDGTGGLVALRRGSPLQADKIINCLGYRYDERRSFEGALPLGPANFGSLFETTAIPEMRAQSAVLAAQITP